MVARMILHSVVALGLTATAIAQTPPTCSLSLTPPSGTPGTSVVAQVTVVPGTGPTSTGLGVVLDASAVGAGALALVDDGLFPDVVAGDLVFSGALSVGLSIPIGTYGLTASVADAQMRSSVCGGLLQVASSLTSTAIASDGFAYVPSGAILQSYSPGGAGFVGSWYEQGGNWIVQPSTMSYTDGVRTLVTSPGRVRTSNAEARRNLFLPAGPIGNVTETVWLGMVLQQTGGASANTFGGLTLPTGPGTGLFVGKPFNRTNWGIERGVGTTLLSSVAVTSSAFLVVRIDFRPGNDDVYLWINPSLAGTPTLGTASVAAPGYGDFENIRILLLHAGGSGAITMDADEVRLGRSFADVAPFARPGHDECAGALPAFLGRNQFDNSVASTSIPAASCAGMGADTWFEFIPPTSGRFAFETCGDANFDTVLALYDSCSGVELACNDDACGLQSRLTLCATAGTSIFVRVGGFNGAIGYGSFVVTAGDPSDAGETIATAGVTLTSTITGVIGDECGNIEDADVYIIGITDPANFVATTVGGASFDTQLFLFDAAGVGISANDDSPAGGLQSTLTGAFVPTPGLYYLAISSYDKDPLDSALAPLWLDTPFNVERSPDGPGAGNPFTSFDAGAASGGAYTIFLVGANTPVKPSKCIAGWLALDDVCPTTAGSGAMISDTAPGGKGGMLSTPAPKGVSGTFVDHAVLFGDSSSGTVSNTYVTFNPNQGLQLIVGAGAGGYSAMAWVSPNPVATTTDLVILDALGSETAGYRIYLHPVDFNSATSMYDGFELRADVRLGGILVRQLLLPTSGTPGGLTIRAGSWTHVAISGSWGSSFTNGLARLQAFDYTQGTRATPASTPLAVASSDNSGILPRVAATAGASPGLFFRGLIDEVQIYKCELTGAEVNAIQDAGPSGVIKDKVVAPWETSNTGGPITEVQAAYIQGRNGQPGEMASDIRLAYGPTPAGGSGAYCNASPFPAATFSPTVLAAAPHGITPFTLRVNTDWTRFIGHACFNIYATDMRTGVTAVGMGSVVDHPRWSADLDPGNPINIGHPRPGVDTFGFKEVPIGGSTDWAFRLRNTTPMDRTVEFKIMAMSADMSMAPVAVSLVLAPGAMPGSCGMTGNPVCGVVMVPANSTLSIPVVTATLNALPSASELIEVVFHANVDGSDTITGNEDLASGAMIATLMPTPPSSCACHGACPADFDDGSGLGEPDGGVTIDDLLYYLSIFEAGVPCADVDDGSGTGVPDGGVTIDDLLFFLVRFESGC